MSARLKEKLKERFDERSINNDLWGRKCANQIFLESLISYDHFHNKLAYEITLKKHQAIIEYLLDKYGYTIKTNRKEELQGNLNNIENVIWTFWWQGESMAPEMIKQCIASMKQNSNGHEVIVISEANYMQYIQVPDYISDKVKRGIITYTHLSDIIRMLLLKTYGGLWLDATIFVTDKIPDSYFNYNYFTAKLPRQKISCISEFRWSGNVMGGKKQYCFFSYMCDFFAAYWKQEEKLIDYFLIDYATEIALQNMDNFREDFERLDYNNVSMYDIGRIANEECVQEHLKEIMDATIFHKLQRRDKYLVETHNHKLTYYGALLKKELNHGNSIET